jgi:NADH-ubiquinone oxidoreductase chain 5
LLSGSAEIELISFLVLAAVTQCSNSFLLAAAIAAPMPVSTLVHSSALVTAGVYILICFSPSFSY